jgi:hypothetical protein
MMICGFTKISCDCTKIRNQFSLLQGVSVQMLMTEFDLVRREHELIDAGAFNNDHTYKEKLNQVIFLAMIDYDAAFAVWRFASVFSFPVPTFLMVFCADFGHKERCYKEAGYSHGTSVSDISDVISRSSDVISRSQANLDKYVYSLTVSSHMNQQTNIASRPSTPCPFSLKFS